MKNQRSVFEFGNEYVCTMFYDVDSNYSGVEIKENGHVYLGKLVGVTIPDFEDDDECIKFDNEVIDWIVDNQDNADRVYVDANLDKFKEIAEQLKKK
jgi:hypothetical protein